MDFRTVGLETLVSKVRAKEVSARELVEHSLAVIDRADELNAWAELDPDGARRRASEIDQALAAGAEVGPLAGIPLGVKDMEDAIGFTTGYGSLLRDDLPATEDSVLTARLRAAGCVVLGKTTTPEHGWMGDTWSPRTGTTRNAWDPSRSPGGSSGGTATALASGMIPLGTGSDGGGSIRIPASLCGIAGLKTSAGRVPLGGPRAPGAGTLAVRGPMAVTSRDTAYALAACVGPDPSDPYSLPAADLDWRIPPDVDLPPRVVWSPSPRFPVDEGVAAACARAIAALEAAGTEVVVVENLFGRTPLWNWYVLWTTYRNRAQGHLRGTPDWELIDPGLRADMDWAEEHATAVRVMQAFDNIHTHNLEVERVLASAPILLLPTVASETARCGEQGSIGGVETPQWAPFTQVFNLTRHPAGSVPAGTTAAGLPIGIQVVGPHHADVEVLRAMAGLERLWVDRDQQPFPAW